MANQILIQLLSIVCCTVLLGLAIYVILAQERLFKRIKNQWLRRNLIVLLVAILILSAFLGIQSPFLMAKLKGVQLALTIARELAGGVVVVFFVFNVVLLVNRIFRLQRFSFIKQHVIIVLTIVVAAMAAYATANYVASGWKFNNLHVVLVTGYINAVVTGFIYTGVRYVELERTRKLNEKELEVTRLMALKTKAELEALHSKINPHFLYNALNSIADLSITDGRKARRMTIALADLFRFSINYSNNNFSTIKEEVEMAEVYLQIEKIRFEDQLNYSIKVEEEMEHYLVPRFILQPIVENAVKHGLKATGKMTQIVLEVKKKDDVMMLTVIDNGPPFPEELNPGYGLKSTFDKLDLLFPDAYELHFSNDPVKQVSVHIKKMIKNEPAL